MNYFNLLIMKVFEWIKCPLIYIRFNVNRLGLLSLTHKKFTHVNFFSVYLIENICVILRDNISPWLQWK